MSFWYSSRTDDVYSATSLGNWQRPRVGPQASAVADSSGRPWVRQTRSKHKTPGITPTTRPNKPGTLVPDFLVDGNGHLRPEKKAPGRTAFNSTGYDGYMDEHKQRHGGPIASVGAAGGRRGKEIFGAPTGYLVSNSEWPAERSFPYPLGGQVLLDGMVAGKVAYHGRVEFASGEWVGVLLSEPAGRNDGCVNGKRYFRAEPDHGIFLRAGSKRLRPMSTAVKSCVPAVKYDDRFVHSRFGSGTTRGAELKRPNSARPAAVEGYMFGTIRPASAGGRPQYPGGVSIRKPAWS